MRTATRAVVALGLALAVVVGAAGAAWATFRSPASVSASISTLTLQPPDGEPTQVSCTGTAKKGHTLVVEFPDSPSEADLANRAGPAPATALGYSATATYSAGKQQAAGGSTSGSVTASSGTSNTISLSTSDGGTRTWSVSITTTYSGWTSTSVTNTNTITC